MIWITVLPSTSNVSIVEVGGFVKHIGCQLCCQTWTCITISLRGKEMGPAEADEPPRLGLTQGAIYCAAKAQFRAQGAMRCALYS